MATKNVAAKAAPVAKTGKSFPAMKKEAETTAKAVIAKAATPKAKAKVVQPVELVAPAALDRKALAAAVRVRIQEQGFGITPALALSAVEAAEAVIFNSLAAGTEINLTGFGKFKLTKREAREARNPSTNEVVAVPAAWAVAFKPSLLLKQAVKARPTE